MTTYTFEALVFENTYSFDDENDTFGYVNTTDVSFVTDSTISSFSYAIDYEYEGGAEVTISGNYGTILDIDLGNNSLSTAFIGNGGSIYASVSTLEWGDDNETTYLNLSSETYDEDTDSYYAVNIVVVLAGDAFGDISSADDLYDFIDGITGESFNPHDGFGAGDTISLDGIATVSQDDDFSGNGLANIVDLGAGNDTYNGKAGDDIVSGGAGGDTIQGSAGDDIISGNGGHDELIGGNGNDELIGGNGNDDLSGGNGNDTLSGGAGSDLLVGGDGNDVLDGGDGNDSLKGLDGRDTLNGGEGNDELIGGKGRDALDGGAGRDSLSGGNGLDILFGGGGSDYVSGGGGNDLIYGGANSDELEGDNGDDIIEGGNGDDSLFGGNGNDELFGGNGNDLLSGGNGDDHLHGGAGQDVFEFESTAASGNDTIYDWEDVDTIRLYGVTEDEVSVTSSGGDTTIEYGDGIVLTLSTVTDTDAVFDSIDFA